MILKLEDFNSSTTSHLIEIDLVKKDIKIT
jgi:hypothetical protein